MEDIKYVHLIEIDSVVIEIRGAENGELADPVNNTLVHLIAFLATDTRPYVIIFGGMIIIFCNKTITTLGFTFYFMVSIGGDFKST